MAIVKSNIVTLADDLDSQIGREQAHTKEITTKCKYAAAGAIADNDVILMCEVPVEATISSIRMYSDDLGTTGDLNLGFYPGPGSGTTISADTDAVDEDAIGTAIDVNAAATANVEVRFETKDFNTLDDKAWEIAGLSAKPDYSTFYLAFTASEATTAAGDLALVIRHSE
jgi:hypothetical protein